MLLADHQKLEKDDERVSPRAIREHGPACLHLDFKLLISGTEITDFCCFKPSSFWYFVWQPQEIKTVPKIEILPESISLRTKYTKCTGTLKFQAMLGNYFFYHPTQVIENRSPYSGLCC